MTRRGETAETGGGAASEPFYTNLKRRGWRVITPGRHGEYYVIELSEVEGRGDG